MAELDAPKGIAASILGSPGMEASSPLDAVEGEGEEVGAEETALGMVADEMIVAFETKDRAALVSALRSLLTTARSGG